MSSIRRLKNGKEVHWTDAWRKFAVGKIATAKQKKSKPGQLLLFGDDSIRNLTKDKSK